MTLTKEQLITLYLDMCLADSYTRCAFKKLVTKFNRANPKDPLTMDDVFKDRFPSIYAYAKNNTKQPHGKIFENKFTKKLTNIVCELSHSRVGAFSNYMLMSSYTNPSTKFAMNSTPSILFELKTYLYSSTFEPVDKSLKTCLEVHIDHAPLFREL